MAVDAENAPAAPVPRNRFVLLGPLNLGRGAIHVFAYGGGAVRIADFLLSDSLGLVVSLLAVMGLQLI